MQPSPSRPRSALREFLANEASGGIILIVASAAALITANSDWGLGYVRLIHMPVGPMTLLHWINDGLMALFFLLVGLEIKRELVDGHLATWPDRLLPLIAATAGMIVPMLIYRAITAGQSDLTAGWAIPAATDIAFAIAVLALVGKHIPTSLKLLLTTVAIADDMGAIGIIAIGYTKSINMTALLIAGSIAATLAILNRIGVRVIAVYLGGFGALWEALMMSGVHATVAGVLTAMLVPARVTPAAPDATDSPLHRLEHMLQKPVAWVVVPLFGFANAGVVLAGVNPLTALPLAIALGLIIGKQVGIFGSIWLSVKVGLAPRPAGASWIQIYGMSLLCGIGFTMSLFIGGLAFTGAAQSDAVKLGVLLGSGLSAVAGWIILRRSSPLAVKGNSD
jgi:Na+:H+ antiporter, NhaA family